MIGPKASAVHPRSRGMPLFALRVWRAAQEVLGSCKADGTSHVYFGPSTPHRRAPSKRAHDAAPEAVLSCDRNRPGSSDEATWIGAESSGSCDFTGRRLCHATESHSTGKLATSLPLPGLVLGRQTQAPSLARPTPSAALAGAGAEPRHEAAFPH